MMNIIMSRGPVCYWQLNKMKMRRRKTTSLWIMLADDGVTMTTHTTPHLLYIAIVYCIILFYNNT